MVQLSVQLCAMNTRFLLIILQLFLSATISAQQVVHIESKRLKGDKQGYSGNIDLNINFIQNQNDIFQLNNSGQLQYKDSTHSVLLLHNLNLTHLNENKIVNEGFQHLRYSYSVIEFIAFEAFLQSMYNQLVNIKFRGLAGYGPRFKIIDKDSMRLFVGTMLMHEYEQETNGKINKADRLNLFTSFGFPIKEKVHFDMIMYYQPDVLRFHDYRLSTEAVIQFKFSKHLYFRFVQSWVYDAYPPEGVRNFFYNFRNGIRYEF
jgi:hypothetical protein